MTKFYCYKMTWDTGFAPNPFHNVLTLATCKPNVRKLAQVGDWICGWTATTVKNSDEKVIHKGKVGEEQLIYLAKVTQKISFAEYWEQYSQKRPTPKIEDDKTLPISSLGDNIYKPLPEGGYEQISNDSHKEKDKKRDLSTDNVLVCEEFYYFGTKHCHTISENHPKLCRNYRLFDEKDPEFSIIGEICSSHKVGIQDNII